MRLEEKGQYVGIGNPLEKQQTDFRGYFRPAKRRRSLPGVRQGRQQSKMGNRPQRLDGFQGLRL